MQHSATAFKLLPNSAMLIMFLYCRLGKKGFEHVETRMDECTVGQVADARTQQGKAHL